MTEKSNRASPTPRPLISRETFEARVNEMIALIRAEEGLSPGMRRCLWLRLFDLADQFHAMTAAGASAPACAGDGRPPLSR